MKIDAHALVLTPITANHALASKTFQMPYELYDTMLNEQSLPQFNQATSGTLSVAGNYAPTVTALLWFTTLSSSLCHQKVFIYCDRGPDLA